MDFQAWHCMHEKDGEALFCPLDGCPKSYGCARDKGWLPSMDSPRECLGLPALDKLVGGEGIEPPTSCV